MLKRRLHRLVGVYTCQNTTLLEITCQSSDVFSKSCLKWPPKTKTKIGFQDRLSLNAGQKYCRMLCNTFEPSFSYHLSLRHLFGLFLSGRLRHVLLFMCAGWGE